MVSIGYEGCMQAASGEDTLAYVRYTVCMQNCYTRSALQFLPEIDRLIKNGMKRFRRTIGNSVGYAKMLTLGQAAKSVGVSKSTISKALKSGKLSYVEKTTAGYQIDPAELQRVFPVKREVNGSGEQLETDKSTIETSALVKEVEVLREMITELQGERDYARTQASEWQAQAARVTALIEIKDKPKKGFLARLFGG